MSPVEKAEPVLFLFAANETDAIGEGRLWTKQSKVGGRERERGEHKTQTA